MFVVCLSFESETFHPASKLLKTEGEQLKRFRKSPKVTRFTRPKLLRVTLGQAKLQRRLRPDELTGRSRSKLGHPEEV